MARRLVVPALYFFVTGACVAVSTYSTIRGFWSLLEALAIPVGLIIGAALFASNYIVKDRIDHGRAVGAALLMLLVAMSGSVVSNFNYFYTNAISDFAVNERFKKAYGMFYDNHLRALGFIEDIPAAQGRSAREEYIENEFTNLREEALDASELGIGQQAKGHIDNILSRLDVPMADVVIPPLGSPAEEVATWIDGFEARVRLRFQNMDENDALLSFRNKLDGRLAEAAAIMTRSDRELTGDDMRAHIDTWEDYTSTLGTELQNALRSAGSGDSNIPENLLKFNAISSRGSELGTIYFSLEDGFVRRTSVGITGFALVASLLIDIIPLLFGILLLDGRTSRFADDDFAGFTDPADPSGGIEELN